MDSLPNSQERVGIVSLHRKILKASFRGLR